MKLPEPRTVRPDQDMTQRFQWLFEWCWCVWGLRAKRFDKGEISAHVGPLCIWRRIDFRDEVSE